MAGTAGHVVSSNVRRSAFRCSQADSKASGQVEQNFRHEVASVAKCLLTVCLSLADQLVVGLLEQVFKCDQVFQVSHVQAPLKFFAFNNRQCMNRRTEIRTPDKKPRSYARRLDSFAGTAIYSYNRSITDLLLIVKQNIPPRGISFV